MRHRAVNEETILHSVQDLRDSHSESRVELFDEEGGLDSLILRPEDLYP